MLQEIAETFDESAMKDSSARDSPSHGRLEADEKLRREEALVKTMNQFAWAIALVRLYGSWCFTASPR